MYPYEVHYFDKHQLFLGKRLIAVPGRETFPLKKLILNSYWSVDNLGDITPAYAVAVPQRHGSYAEPVLVVKTDA